MTDVDYNKLAKAIKQAELDKWYESFCQEVFENKLQYTFLDYFIVPGFLFLCLSALVGLTYFISVF